MTHEVTRATLRSPAWHGLGEIIPSGLTVADALRITGLEWDPLLAPIQCEGQNIDGHRAVIRSDSRAVLGVVSEHYIPIPHRRLFDLAEIVQDLVPGAEPESALELRGGRNVVLLMRTGTWTIGAGDRTVDYLALTTSHDGSAAVRVYPTSVRIVCRNTLTLAENSVGKNLVARIHHNRDSRAKMETLEEGIRFSIAGLAEWQGVANALRDKRYDDDDARAIVNDVLSSWHPRPSEWKDIEQARRWTRRLERSGRRIADGMWTYNREHVHAEEPLNAWTLYNAITGVIEHERGTPASRARRSLDPASQDTRRKLDLARALVAL